MPVLDMQYQAAAPIGPRRHGSVRGAASPPQTPRKRVSPLVLAVVIAVVVAGVALGSFVSHIRRTSEAEVTAYLTMATGEYC